jgi:hypothetical protein
MRPARGLRVIEAGVSYATGNDLDTGRCCGTGGKTRHPWPAKSRLQLVNAYRASGQKAAKAYREQISYGKLPEWLAKSTRKPSAQPRHEFCALALPIAPPWALPADGERSDWRRCGAGLGLDLRPGVTGGYLDLLGHAASGHTKFLQRTGGRGT